MSNIEPHRQAVSRSHKSHSNKENIGAMPSSRRHTMDGTKLGTGAGDFKQKTNSVARSALQERRAFRDVANFDRNLGSSERDAGNAGSRRGSVRKNSYIPTRSISPTPTGSSGNIDITDLFSRLSFIDSQNPIAQETTLPNESSSSICHFCSNSQEGSTSDQTCQCHRYSCVFDQSSGLLNDSQSTPIRDQESGAEELPPWMFTDTQTQTQAQAQTQNNYTMSMATLQEALKSIVMSPCISEEEDVDVSCLSPARISLLPPLARSISLGYIPRAFPQELPESIAESIPAP